MMAKKPAAKAEKTKKTKSTAERVAEPVKKAGKVIREGAAQAMANTAAINAKVSTTLIQLVGVSGCSARRSSV